MFDGALQTRLDPRVPDSTARHPELKTSLRWPSSEPDNSLARRSGHRIGKPCDDEQYGETAVLFETARLVIREGGMTSETHRQPKSIDGKSKQEGRDEKEGCHHVQLWPP
jgi:hypothetical protein